MIYRTSAGLGRHRFVAKLREPRKSSGAAREAVILQPHLLQHADEDIAQRAIDLIVKLQMLPMLKTTAGKNDREVDVVVNVGISHVATIEQHGVIE